VAFCQNYNVKDFIIFEVEAKVEVERFLALALALTSTLPAAEPGICNFSIYSYIYHFFGGLAHPDSYREARAYEI